MPHAVRGRFCKSGLCGVLDHETIDAELTGRLTALVCRERRTATGFLAPRPAIVSLSIVDCGLGTKMSMHDAVCGNGGGREEGECEYENRFHCGIWTFRW